MEDENCEKEFSPRDGNAKFKARVDSVFSALGALEKKHEEVVENRGDQDTHDVDDQQDPSMLTDLDPNEKRSLKNEKCWSQSRDPKRKRRHPAHVPDHVLHPEKWQKYSLEDDGTQNVGLKGDALNKSIALKFLAELAQRKSHESPSRDERDSEDNTSDTFVFKRPHGEDQNDRQTLEKNEGNFETAMSSSGTAFRMPTYAVGVNPVKQLEKRTVSGKTMELSLSHLDSSDNTENEDNKTEEPSRIRAEHSVEENITFKSKRKNRVGVRKRVHETEVE